jgi:hypothetical protein
LDSFERREKGQRGVLRRGTDPPPFLEVKAPTSAELEEDKKKKHPQGVLQPEFKQITSENCFDRCVIDDEYNVDCKTGTQMGPHKVCTIVRFVDEGKPLIDGVPQYSDFQIKKLNLTSCMRF